MSLEINYLDDTIFNMINDKTNLVREDILSGQINFESDTINSYISKKENKLKDWDNKITLRNMIYAFKIKISNEKRKQLEENLNKIEIKVNKLNNQKKSEFSPKLFSNKLIISHISNVMKLPRSLRISDDLERKQKENVAKFFVKKLNKEKSERVIREEERRKKKETKFLEIASKIFKSKSAEKNDKSENNEKSESNIENYQIKEGKRGRISNKSPKTKTEIILPMIKNSNTSQMINNKMNNKSTKVVKNEDSTINYTNVNDNSVSFRSIKKSPYYFNDPKYAKLLQIKQRYKYKKMVSGISPLNDIKYYSDGGPSLEEYEILKNWEKFS